MSLVDPACHPYTCPGRYVHIGVPFGFVDDMRRDTQAKLEQTDLDWLHQHGAGYDWAQVVRPNPAWDAQKRADATLFLKLSAEVLARKHYRDQKGSYTPYTSDALCTKCYGWNTKPWEWKGVRSAPRRMDSALPVPWHYPLHIINCGMLKDAGVIDSPADCSREKLEVESTYQDWWIAKRLKQKKKHARAMMTVKIVHQVAWAVLSIAASVVAGPLGAAFAGTSGTLMQLQTSGSELETREILIMVATSLAAVVGGAAATVAASASAAAAGSVSAAATLAAAQTVSTTAVVLKAAISMASTTLEVIEGLDAQKEARQDIAEQRDRVLALNQRVAELIELRESLDLVVAAINETKAEIARLKALAGPSKATYALLAASGLAFAMLLTRRR